MEMDIVQDSLVAVSDDGRIEDVRAPVLDDVAVGRTRLGEDGRFTRLGDDFEGGHLGKGVPFDVDGLVRRFHKDAVPGVLDGDGEAPAEGDRGNDEPEFGGFLRRGAQGDGRVADEDDLVRGVVGHFHRGRAALRHRHGGLAGDLLSGVALQRDGGD